MHPLAQAIADAFRRDFWSADQSIKWTSAEEDHVLWLSPNTVLVGTIDAKGITDQGKGDKFFADWKSISVRKAGKNNQTMWQVKAEWRMDPQALCYGLLLGDEYRRFTVRWGIKSNPVTTDFEWYSYTDDELQWWRKELLVIANNIRHERQQDLVVKSNWPTNLTACTRYGWNFRCPFYDNGCTKLNFNHTPEGMKPKDHHLDLEAKIKSEFKGDSQDLVILSSSSIDTWLTCPEKYRRYWEGEGLTEDSEALTIGREFHQAQADYIRSLIPQSEKEIA